MFVVATFRILGVLFLLQLSACSTIDYVFGPSDTEPSASEQEASLKDPVEVEIAQAFVDKDDNLHVKVHVTALTDIRPPEVVLRFRGLETGDIRLEKQRFLSEDTKREELVAGETVVSRFIVPSEGLSEYQVECVWGEEVSELLAKQDSGLLASEEENSQASEVTAVLEEDMPMAEEQSSVSLAASVRVIEVDQQPTSCDSDPCPFRMVVTASLENDGLGPIGQAELAVGLVWREMGTPLPEPSVDAEPQPGEDVLALRDLNIPPAGKRLLKLTISDAVPVVPGGAFEPTVRVLAVDSPEKNQ